MDINIVNPAGASQGSTMSVQARGSDIPVQRRSQVQDEPVKVAAVEKADIRASEGQREARVVDAAQHLFQDVFAVSDSTFSIFKDASGQFITRFTNLRDGSVTYIPEPDIIRYMESKSQQREALVEIDA